MPKTTKYPSTPEIDAMKVSRQRKLQLRAVLAGACSSCMSNPLSELYPKSNRCDPCRDKIIKADRKRICCKKPQPHRTRPRCDEILEAVKKMPLEAFKDAKQMKAIAKELKCPVGFITRLRRNKLGITFKRGRPRK